MAEGYCWMCDRAVDEDPCPVCGTPQYRRSVTVRSVKMSDEVLDTTPALRPAVGSRNPLVIGVIVLAVVVVLVLVFRAGAGIS